MPAENYQSTTQVFLDIYDITNDLLIMKDGTVSVIITVDAMNFGLLAEEEQDAVMYAYAGLLNSLNYPIQIVIRSQTKDVTAYLQKLKEQEDLAQTRENQNRIGRYREFVSNLIRERNVLDKKFYVVVPATSIELGILPASSVLPGKQQIDITSIEKSVILEKARSILEPKRDHIIGQFGRIGLYARQLNTQEIIQLFYLSYNPEAADGQQLTDTRNYTTPLVSASVDASVLRSFNTSTVKPNPSTPQPLAQSPSPTQEVVQAPINSPQPTPVETATLTPAIDPSVQPPEQPITPAPINQTVEQAPIPVEQPQEQATANIPAVEQIVVTSEPSPPSTSTSSSISNPPVEISATLPEQMPKTEAEPAQSTDVLTTKPETLVQTLPPAPVSPTPVFEAAVPKHFFIPPQQQTPANITSSPQPPPVVSPSEPLPITTDTKSVTEIPAVEPTIKNVSTIESVNEAVTSDQVIDLTKTLDTTTDNKPDEAVVHSTIDTVAVAEDPQKAIDSLTKTLPASDLNRNPSPNLSLTPDPDKNLDDTPLPPLPEIN